MFSRLQFCCRLILPSREEKHREEILEKSVTQTAARRALFTCPDLCRRSSGDMTAVVDEVSTLLREEHKSPLKTSVAALQTALELLLRLAGTRLKTLGCCICTASSKKRENL